MYLELSLRYLHFISIFTIVGSLAAEWVLLKKEMLPAEIARLSRIDALYGLSALTLLTAGFTLWLGGVGKPTSFYSNNWIFWLKIGLYSLLGILSIYPTVFFLQKSRKTLPPDVPIAIPPVVAWSLWLELLLLLFIPLCAGLMARGIGSMG
jgi:putative membrane protein